MPPRALYLSIICFVITHEDGWHPRFAIRNSSPLAVPANFCSVHIPSAGHVNIRFFISIRFVCGVRYFLYNEPNARISCNSTIHPYIPTVLFVLRSSEKLRRKNKKSFFPPFHDRGGDAGQVQAPIPSGLVLTASAACS